MRRRGGREGNIPSFTTSPDALSLATNRGRKVERNKGNRAKRKEEKEKYREANGVKRGSQCQVAPPDPASVALVLLPRSRGFSTTVQKGGLRFHPKHQTSKT